MAQRFSLLSSWGMVCRRTWWWRGSWEFYILHRQQEVVYLTDRGLTYMRPQSLSPHWHTSSNKTTPTLSSAHLLIMPLAFGGYFLSNHHRQVTSPLRGKRHLSCTLTLPITKYRNTKLKNERSSRPHLSRLKTSCSFFVQLLYPGNCCPGHSTGDYSAPHGHLGLWENQTVEALSGRQVPSQLSPAGLLALLLLASPPPIASFDILWYSHVPVWSLAIDGFLETFIVWALWRCA